MTEITYICNLCMVHFTRDSDQIHGIHFSVTGGLGKEVIEIKPPRDCHNHLCLECCEKLVSVLPPLFYPVAG